MTNEERNQVAIDAMQFFKQKLNNGIYGEFIGNFDTAISAIKKQIPEKPTPHIVQPVEAPIKIGNGRWQKGTTVYKCPNCKEWVSKTYKHCHDCGQALDFNSNGSDTE